MKKGIFSFLSLFLAPFAAFGANEGVPSYYQTQRAANALFYRENASLKKGDRFGAMYAVDQVYTFSIERVGQAVTVTVTCGESIATTTHTDFDFFARDTEFMYVGMFANRGTVVEFSNVQFEITGTSQGA